MHDTPEIDVDERLPGVEILPGLSGVVADAGIVHQEGNAAETRIGGVREAGEIIGLGDIAGDGQNLAGVASCRCDFDRGGIEGRASTVSEHDLHAESGKAMRGCQPDAAGTAGDDGDAAGGQGGKGGLDVSGHESLRLSGRPGVARIWHGA